MDNKSTIVSFPRVHVVFGLVISGFEVIKKIEGLKTDSASRPYADVRVVDCGQLITKSAHDGRGSHRCLHFLNVKSYDNTVRQVPVSSQHSSGTFISCFFTFNDETQTQLAAA